MLLNEVSLNILIGIIIPLDLGTIGQIISDPGTHTGSVDNHNCLPELEFLKKIYGGYRHRVGIGLSYRAARLHRLAEFIPWNRFLGSINV
jgi:hypothetical protein